MPTQRTVSTKAPELGLYLVHVLRVHVPTSSHPETAARTVREAELNRGEL